VLVSLFAVYLALLAWIVLWKLEVPWIGEAALLPRPIKLIPFLPSAEAGASAPIEVAINFVLFIPFGLYLGVIAPSWGWWQAAGVLLGASLVLEITQHLISVGSFDTTDLIVNTAGGLAGLGLLALARRRLRARTEMLMTRGFAIGTVILLVAIAIFIASPLHYGPQRDVIVSAPAAVPHWTQTVASGLGSDDLRPLSAPAAS
jgi:glycopeptide antibiotics resistance protein